MSNINSYKDLFSNKKSGQEMVDSDLKKATRSAKIVKYMWITFLSLGLVLFLIFILIYNGIIGYMPPIEELKNPRDKFASIICC